MSNDNDHVHHHTKPGGAGAAAAGHKIFDVARPGKALPPATSKPVIVGHKPQVRDPMIGDTGDAADTPADGAAFNKHGSLPIDALAASQSANTHHDDLSAAENGGEAAGSVAASQPGVGGPAQPADEMAASTAAFRSSEDEVPAQQDRGLPAPGETGSAGTLAAALPPADSPPQPYAQPDEDSIEAAMQREQAAHAAATGQEHGAAGQPPAAPLVTPADLGEPPADDQLVAATNAPTIAGQKAFVSHHIRHRWRNGSLALLLGIVIGLAMLDLLIDSGHLVPRLALPHTHFFGK